jgi:uncharacterized protein
MAFWDKISSRGQVEDRRGSRTALVGGGGIGAVVIMLVLNYFMTGTVDPGQVLDQLNQLQNTAITQQNLDTSAFEGEDSYEVFASTVLGSANDMWSQVFSKNNRTYTPPHLVLFRELTQGGCGYSSSEVGPHYCPEDGTIYLDETFFDELTRRFGAQGGDVAEAYVIAHEVGHHVQRELGILNNSDSIAVELQADCFAGLWANSVSHLGVFEPGEIREALDAAAAVGDDRIQRATTGQVNPETWTHGSSEERMAWFNRGFETGSVAECATD